MPPNNVSIVGEQTIVMTDDETISSETPLMNGIYFTSFTSNVRQYNWHKNQLTAKECAPDKPGDIPYSFTQLNYYWIFLKFVCLSDP